MRAKLVFGKDTICLEHIQNPCQLNMGAYIMKRTSNY